LGTVNTNCRSIVLTPLRRIETPGGDVFHGMKNSDPGFCGFGEAYFSAVQHRHVKGWKRHRAMTLNLLVPTGKVQIRVVDETGENSQDFVLGPDDTKTYARLTIPPNLWVAFGGMHTGISMVLNLASHPHDPDEAESCPLTNFPWVWSKSN
jgi:dTDP-4-dehydrorhamnose 3,5-epimerase